MPARDPRTIVYQGFQGVVLADGRDGAAGVFSSKLRFTDRIPWRDGSVPPDLQVLFLGHTALRWLLLCVEEAFARLGVVIHTCVVVHAYPLFFHKLRGFSLLQGEADNLLVRPGSIIVDRSTFDDIREGGVGLPLGRR